MPKIMPKNTNFSGYRSITEVSIEQIFETYTQEMRDIQTDMGQP
jgi:hypothetical protein